MKPSAAAIVALALFTLSAPATGEAKRQDGLDILVNPAGPALEFDWPMIQVGTASYEDGPTGVTVIRFAEKVYSAVDVRGTPGTVNIPYMEMLWDYAELDAVVFAGGSWYGLEAVTGVATALKDDGIRDGNAFALPPSIAHVVGSIIFDFAPRRLNEIYPDKRLGQAALRAAQPGWFPLGATGAGRNARTGAFFGCGSPSGQGGAFRQVGELKIAAFLVVNAYGVVSDRDGRIAACYPGADWPEALRRELRVADLVAHHLEQQGAVLGVHEPEPPRNGNTTVGVVITNQKLTPVELKRLAVQAHSALPRAIHPYTTLYDGDVLYAVSTAELDDYLLSVPALGVLAGEVLWDAVLASVPPQPLVRAAAEDTVISAHRGRELAGDYEFSDFATLRVGYRHGRLTARAVGERDVYAIRRDADTELRPAAPGEFLVPGRHPLVLRFEDDGHLVVNPGSWQQVGRRKP